MKIAEVMRCTTPNGVPRPARHALERGEIRPRSSEHPCEGRVDIGVGGNAKLILQGTGHAASTYARCPRRTPLTAGKPGRTG